MVHNTLMMYLMPLNNTLKKWLDSKFYMYLCFCLVAKSCLFPDTCSLPDSSVRGIFQARILEWAAISFSRGSSQPRDQTHVSCTGRQILHHWATGEAHMYLTIIFKEVMNTYLIHIYFLNALFCIRF